VKENEQSLKNVETKTRGPLSSWPLDPDAPKALLEKNHHFFRQTASAMAINRHGFVP